MAATTTASNNLVTRLATDFPKITFTPGDDFHWSPEQQTVFYDLSQPYYAPQLLHEAAHGILGHDRYMYDIDLIKLERAAWEKAQELALLYGIAIPEDNIEEALDTYRDWLHARSTCPQCGLGGIQQRSGDYTCPVCAQRWRVNDARTCGLKRTKL